MDQPISRDGLNTSAICLARLDLMPVADVGSMLQLVERLGTTVDDGAVITGHIERALCREFCPHIFVSVQLAPAEK